MPASKKKPLPKKYYRPLAALPQVSGLFAAEPIEKGTYIIDHHGPRVTTRSLMNST